MTQHFLQGRTEREVLWFQRRGFLQAAAAWTAAGGFAAAQAQSSSFCIPAITPCCLARSAASFFFAFLFSDTEKPPRFSVIVIKMRKN